MASLRAAAPDVFAQAAAQGDRYFWIPALGRHRGVAHFYLEGYRTGRLDEDAALAHRFGDTTIETHARLRIVRSQYGLRRFAYVPVPILTT